MARVNTSRSPWRERLVAAILVVVSIAASTGAFELALRIVGYRPNLERQSARLTDGTTLLDCYPSNPRAYFDIDLRSAAARENYRDLAVRWRYEAIARRAPHAIECRYNVMGFRDVPLGPRAPGVRRVVLIGDSFTEGQGVKEQDTYARVLERALNAGGPTRWEVRNCAGRGSDFPRLHLTFDEVLPFGADVVLYAMVLNDALPSPAFSARQGYLNDWMLLQGRRTMKPDEDVRSGPRAWAFVRERWENRRVSAESVRYYRDLYDTPNADGWQATQGFIRAMDTSTRGQGGRFAVVLWPWLVDLNGGYPFAATHETIRRFHEAAGIEFHDLRPALAARPTASLWVHPVDWHPNEAAHRIVADTLAPIVRALLPPEPEGSTS